MYVLLWLTGGTVPLTTRCLAGLSQLDGLFDKDDKVFPFTLLHIVVLMTNSL